MLPATKDATKGKPATAHPRAILERMTETQLAQTQPQQRQQPQQAQYAFPIKEITPLPDCKARVVFSDGLEGVDDYSFVLDYPGYGHLSDPENFRKIHITADGLISWGQDLEISWEGTYQRLSGKHWKSALPPNTWQPIEPIEVVQVGAVSPLVVHVKFNNGVEGEIGLENISCQAATLREHSKKGKGRGRGKGKSKGPVITEWGEIVLDGKEYDTADIYERLTGQDIDMAERAYNS